jgi:hypothetical protein
VLNLHKSKNDHQYGTTASPENKNGIFLKKYGNYSGLEPVVD